MCGISPRDTTSSLLPQTDLLVIGEVSMGHKFIDFSGHRQNTSRHAWQQLPLWRNDCVDGRRLAPNFSCCPPRLKIANSQCSSQVIISVEPCQIIYLDREHEGCIYWRIYCIIRLFSKCRKRTTECVQRDWKFSSATPNHSEQ